MLDIDMLPWSLLYRLLAFVCHHQLELILNTGVLALIHALELVVVS